MLILLILCVSGVAGSFEGPENLAVNVGDIATFICRKQPGSKLRWSMKLHGNPIERLLTRDESILPAYVADYAVESSSNSLTLIVKSTNPTNSGKYICLELASSKTASAQLTVIESEPKCTYVSSIFVCDVNYRGNWSPDIDIRPFSRSNISMSPDRVIGQFDISTREYVCNVRFTKQVFDPEILNDVIGLTAKNIPEYSKSVNCKVGQIHPKIEIPKIEIPAISYDWARPRQHSSKRKSSHGWQGRARRGTLSRRN